MSLRALLGGFAKSVLVHRHALVPSVARTVAIGAQARLPASFAEAFGTPAPAPVDAALRRGDWRAARARLRAWASSRPRRPEPHLGLAVLDLWTASPATARAGRLEERIERYASPEGLAALERCARSFPRWSPARLWLALGLLRRTDLAGARRQLDALAAERGDWSWPFLVRSELERVDIRFAPSLADAERAARLDPGNAWVPAFRGRVLAQMGRGAGAAAAMDAAVALSPREGWLRAWRADLRRKLGDLAGARADLRAAMTLEPRYDRSYLWLGKLLRSEGRLKEAERVLSRGLRECPHFEKAFAERARARLALGKIGPALRDLEAAADSNHRHNAFWNWTAEVEPLNAERRAVLEALRAHAAARPRSARAWLWLGEALVQAGEPGAGLAALDCARRLGSGPREACFRGEALMRLGRLPEAERALDAALRRDPHDGRARAFRGRVRFLRGRPSAAVADLELAAADGMIEYSWVYHWRAKARLAAGDRTGARADAQTAAALEPGRREFRELLRVETA